MYLQKTIFLFLFFITLDSNAVLENLSRKLLANKSKATPLEKLLIFLNYRDQELSEHTFFDSIQDSFQELTKDQTRHSLCIAKTVLCYFLKREDFCHFLKNHDHKLWNLVYDLAKQDDSLNLIFNITTLTDNEYEQEKSLFEKEVSSSKKIKYISGKGFYEIKDGTFYWYPPEVKIQPASLQQNEKITSFLVKLNNQSGDFSLHQEFWQKIKKLQNNSNQELGFPCEILLLTLNYYKDAPWRKNIELAYSDLYKEDSLNRAVETICNELVKYKQKLSTYWIDTLKILVQSPLSTIISEDFITKIIQLSENSNLGIGILMNKALPINNLLCSEKLARNKGLTEVIKLWSKDLLLNKNSFSDKEIPTIEYLLSTFRQFKKGSSKEMFTRSLIDLLTIITCHCENNHFEKELQRLEQGSPTTLSEIAKKFGITLSEKTLVKDCCKILKQSYKNPQDTATSLIRGLVMLADLCPNWRKYSDDKTVTDLLLSSANKINLLQKNDLAGAASYIFLKTADKLGQLNLIDQVYFQEKYHSSLNSFLQECAQNYSRQVVLLERKAK